MQVKITSLSGITQQLKKHPGWKRISKLGQLARFAHGMFLCTLLFLLPGTANADWRDDIGRFRIGLVSENSAALAVSNAEPFRLAVEEKLGLPVEIIPMANLARLASAQIEGRVEYAIYPATTFAAAWVNCECIEPLVIAMASDMTSATHSIVVGRASGRKLKAADLAGKQIWLLTAKDAIAQQYAIYALRSAGIAIGEGDTRFLTPTGPRQALERFNNGEGDALIGWSSLQGDPSTGHSRGTLKQLAELNNGSAGDYYLVWKSKPLPHRTHAVRKNLDGEAKMLLRELLVAMFDNDPVAYDAVEPVFGGGFKVATKSEFTGAIEFVRSLLPQNKSGDTKSGDGNEPETEDLKEKSGENGTTTGSD